MSAGNASQSDMPTRWSSGAPAFSSAAPLRWTSLQSASTTNVGSTSASNRAKSEFRRCVFIAYGVRRGLDQVGRFGGLRRHESTSVSQSCHRGLDRKYAAELVGKVLELARAPFFGPTQFAADDHSSSLR